MIMETNSHLTSEDKLWAAIAHASVLFSFLGPVVPAVLWFLQRGKSAHTRFHAMQALAYQISGFWVSTILMQVLMIFMFVAMIFAVGYAERHPSDLVSALGSVIPMLMYVPILGVWGVYMLIGTFGAVASLMGRSFRYPFIGASLQRKLGYQAAPGAVMAEEQEDQVAAAVAHATCIIPLFGTLTPLILWITQKDRGGFIRFQTLQALVYQVLGMAAYIGLLAAYMVFFFGMMGFTILSAQTLESDSSEALIAMLAFLLPVACIFVVLMLGGPVYHLFGFIAGVRVLRGGDYNYPLLGRYLRKRTGTAELAPTEAPA